MGTGTIDEAQAWVEYCNGTGNTYWANLRRKNGHAQPYGVKYWGLGNEAYGALADRRPQRRRLRQEGSRVRQGDEVDRPEHPARELRQERLE